MTLHWYIVGPALAGLPGRNRRSRLGGRLSDAAALDAAVSATVAAIVAAAAEARLAARPLCVQGHHLHLEVPLLSCGPPRSSLSVLLVTRRPRRLVRRPWPWPGLTLLASLTDDVMASPGCGEQGPTSAPPSDLHEHERDGSEDHRHQDHRRQDRRQITSTSSRTLPTAVTWTATPAGAGLRAPSHVISGTRPPALSS